MDKLKYLQLQTLDRHIKELHICDRPTNGWIKAIRRTLSMTINQLAQRLGITQQAAARFEANEISEVITIKSLRKMAEALDCKLVYVFIPNQGSLEETIKKQAYQKAKEIVLSVDHSMQLEAQGVNNIEEKIKDVAQDLIYNLNSKLWD